MPRTCFVIMPFSTTASCTEEQWTWIFENVFKPAIEGADLDYECRRSVATRGNIVAAILQNLDESYVVLADLTDQNANVFYELGVRHSIRDRSILIAQKRDDIPFDLQAYANHVYVWDTEEGRAELTERIRELLLDVDTNPNRPDNPVSDFLRVAAESSTIEPDNSVSPEETAFAQPLAGPGADGLDAVEFAVNLSQEARPQAANTVYRMTRAALHPLMESAIHDLNEREAPASIPQNQIIQIASGYIEAVEHLTQKVEEFVLSASQENWVRGTLIGIRMAGDWISLSERSSPGRSVRFAQGVPAFLAWRMLVFGGARALAEESFDSLAVILKEPIEFEDLSGRFSNRSLLHHRDLFYPDAFLGHADKPMSYIKTVWSEHPHLQRFFVSDDDFQFSVAKLLMIIQLASPPDDSGYPLYPSYRLLPQAVRAMSSLYSKLASSERYRTDIAHAIGETEEQFRQKWPERAQLANSVSLGSGYLTERPVFPEQLDVRITL